MADPFIDVLGGFQANQADKANANVATQNSKTVTMQANAQEAGIRNQGSELTGAQIAAVGASGITMQGTPTDVVLDSKVKTELDALNARYAGAVQRTGYLNQASALRLQGKQALIGGFLKAGSDAIKTASGMPTNPGAQTISGASNAGSGMGMTIPGLG